MLADYLVGILALEAFGPLVPGDDCPWRVEHRQMLADYLVGIVALEALRPLVPGDDVAGWVEQEDGVVASRLPHHLINAAAVANRLREARFPERRDWCYATVGRFLGFRGPVGERMFFSLFNHRGPFRRTERARAKKNIARQR